MIRRSDRLRLLRSTWYEWARRERYDRLAAIVGSRVERDELRQIREGEKLRGGR